MSVVMGAFHLACHQGGKGVLLGGVPGVLPGRVVVIGGGTSGVNAARMATGLGNAPKDAVQKMAEVLLGKSVDNNAADAYWLWRYIQSPPADRKGKVPTLEIVKLVNPDQPQPHSHD